MHSAVSQSLLGKIGTEQPPGMILAIGQTDDRSVSVRCSGIERERVEPTHPLRLSHPPRTPPQCLSMSSCKSKMGSVTEVDVRPWSGWKEGGGEGRGGGGTHLQRDAHLLLYNARVVDVARDAKQLGALVALPSKAGKPLAPAADDRRCNRDRLDVGDRARATEQADVGRKGRLETRLALFALDRLDQGRLLAADVRTRAPVEVDIERVA